MWVTPPNLVKLEEMAGLLSKVKYEKYPNVILELWMQELPKLLDALPQEVSFVLDRSDRVKERGDVKGIASTLARYTSYQNSLQATISTTYATAIRYGHCLLGHMAEASLLTGIGEFYFRPDIQADAVLPHQQGVCMGHRKGKCHCGADTDMLTLPIRYFPGGENGECETCLRKQLMYAGTTVKAGLLTFKYKPSRIVPPQVARAPAANPVPPEPGHGLGRELWAEHNFDVAIHEEQMREAALLLAQEQNARLQRLDAERRRLAAARQVGRVLYGEPAPVREEGDYR